jgi:DNA-binding GntR family transcriptional regulator
MEQSRMQHAYERLREKMLNGELAPGSRLVNRALGAEFGLSTVTVREAIHRLTSEGLVEHVPNAGAFVRTLDRRATAELYRFRAALEEFALGETIRRAEADTLERLDRLCDRMRALCAAARSRPGRRLEGPVHADWLATDLDFHRELAAAAENRWLTKTLQDLDLMARIAATKGGTIGFGPAAATYRIHREIVRALRARDLGRALVWMRSHDRLGLDSLGLGRRDLGRTGEDRPPLDARGP